MKQLIIIRHAKSSWEYDVIDHERPLNERGVNDANLVGNKLKELSIILDLVLVSDAKRTTDTANIILKKLNIDKHNVEFKHSLYDFAGMNLVHEIKNLDNSLKNVMVFGHNYAITSFVNTFGSIIIDNVPTCGVVIIQFDTDKWSQIGQGKTITTIFPKSLR